MRHENVKSGSKLRLEGLRLCGVDRQRALPGRGGVDKPDAPWWYYPALAIGMATSILGMAFRYMAHLHQKREMKRTKAEARSPHR